MLKPYKSGLPLNDNEREPEPTLQGAFARFEATIVRRRYRRGYHQGYLSRATPRVLEATKRLVGEHNDD